MSEAPESVLVVDDSDLSRELPSEILTPDEVSQPQGPLVAVNIAGLDDNVFSDTLFGHVKGAFTGADRARPGMIEKAAGGTLFLDEIGDLNPLSQVKLLRLLQEKEFMPLGSDKTEKVNARIVVATNVDLEQKQKMGLFRKDLYFRLFSHRIEVPPLRERKKDIPVLLEHFLEDAAREMDKKKPTPPAELFLLLSNYSFPGNIRELRAMAFNAVSMHKGRMLSMEPFQKAVGVSGKSPTENRVEFKEGPLLTFHESLPTLKQTADLLVREALHRTKGNQSMAARLLGITQPALSSRLKKMSE